MKNFLQALTLVSAILLVVSVLLQSQGSGLGAGFGGDSNFYRSKRGIEKFLFFGTIVLAVIFFGSLLAGLIIQK
ncbi:preprotein translocase subunit SecG [bacterium]|nr:preprotein translocase subunit SecG [bacterium]